MPHRALLPPAWLALLLIANGGFTSAQEASRPALNHFDPRVQPAAHLQPAPPLLSGPIPNGNITNGPLTGPANLQPAGALNTRPNVELPLAPRGDKPASPLLPRRESPATKREAGGASWTSMLASLGVVLGLFLMLTWFVKRGMPAHTKRLPSEVVEVLGMTPLAGRHTAQLIRVGNKLLLVSIVPGGAETLTEITDPLEIDRLAGLCRAQQSQSTTASFRSLLEQFGRERPSTADIRTPKNFDRRPLATDRAFAAAEEVDDE